MPWHQRQTPLVCQECDRDDFSSQYGLDWHRQRWHNGPAPVRVLPAEAPALEEEAPAAEEEEPMVQQQQPAPGPLAVSPQPEVAMSNKDIRIQQLEAQVTQLTTQLSQGVHAQLGTILAHEDQACAECKKDLEEYREGIIKKAFLECDPGILAKVAVARGVLPNISIQVPTR